MLKFVFLLFLSFPVLLLYGQKEWTISGSIKDRDGIPIEMVNIRAVDFNYGTTSDKLGQFILKIKTESAVVLNFTAIGYNEKNIAIPFTKEGYQLNLVLENTNELLSEVNIVDQKSKEKGLTQIDPLLLNNIPNISGNQIQNFIKTLPGVASANELSSTYSVRGGNFDENLTYINDIEIFRPMLLQSGQQEGLSMVNSDLVSKVEFSSGGFNAVYDDKMSSVLDIQYKKPSEFRASSSFSLFGASAHLEGRTFGEKLSYLAGIRYKNTQYLLNTLETQGEYKPNFFDFQTFVGYKFTKKLSFNALAYHANNNYLFFPDDRNTSFGTANEALNLYVDFEGNEKDKFTSSILGLTFDFQASNNLNLKFIASAYSSKEALTYDIEGRYSLNQLDKELGSSTFGDSILNLGIGRFIEHARSYLNARIFNLNHNAWLLQGNHFIQWGVKYQIEQINDKINEWKMMDSAGYSIPQSNNILELAESWHSENSLNSSRISSFLQAGYKASKNASFNIEYGTRVSWWNINKQLLVSPRISFGYYPSGNKNLYLRLAGGLYYQSVFYREMIDKQGNMNTSVKTPYSIQYTISGDYDFKMLDRPFHFKAAIYYKNLKQIIPYSIDNIRINYYPLKMGNGFAGGLDLKLNGEFVKGTDSWLSFSLMKSGIQIEGDTIGQQSLPNDHFANISLFFQDYIPGNKRFKMYLALFYLSGQPFGPPNNDTYYAPLRMPSYKRVDIGFSIILKQEEKIYQPKFTNAFKSIVLNFEVFNLLGINNTVSYNWVTVVPNTSVIGNDNYNSFAVPNRLTARRFNIRLSMLF